MVLELQKSGIAPFDYAPESCADHALEQALAEYANPRNWDIDGEWIGPGDGPDIAQEAMK